MVQNRRLPRRRLLRGKTMTRSRQARECFVTTLSLEQLFLFSCKVHCFLMCGLFAWRIIWELVYGADFDGMTTVPLEDFPSCLHVFANERL